MYPAWTASQAEALAAALYGHADTVKRILRYQVAERREDLEAKERQKLEVRFNSILIRFNLTLIRH